MILNPRYYPLEKEVVHTSTQRARLLAMDSTLYFREIERVVKRPKNRLYGLDQEIFNIIFSSIGNLSNYQTELDYSLMEISSSESAVFGYDGDIITDLTPYFGLIKVLADKLIEDLKFNLCYSGERLVYTPVAKSIHNPSLGICVEPIFLMHIPTIITEA
jgi:hypothetical protein